MQQTASGYRAVRWFLLPQPGSLLFSSSVSPSVSVQGQLFEPVSAIGRLCTPRARGLSASCPPQEGCLQAAVILETYQAPVRIVRYGAQAARSENASRYSDGMSSAYASVRKRRNICIKLPDRIQPQCKIQIKEMRVKWRVLKYLFVRLKALADAMHSISFSQ